MGRANYSPSPAKIKVIGLGGGGSNAISRMVQEGIQGVEFIVANTDAQALKSADAPTKIHIGDKLTRGLGAGGNPEGGFKAAMESRDELAAAVQGADMIFLAAGMGGGTGTGSAPVVAELAKSTGALTIAVVTKPFAFEGARRQVVAEEGLARLSDKCDTLIVIPNDRLLQLCDQKAGMEEAFRFADDVLRHGVQAIAEVITVPGEINLDFADVKAVMSNAGPAWMSIGQGSGHNRAVEAAKSALASPLLDVSVRGATGVLFNISGDETLTLHEVNEAAQVVSKAVDSQANIIFGVVRNDSLGNEVKITLIATGFVSKLQDNAPSKNELRQLMRRDIAEEGELDIPTYMRNQPYRKMQWQGKEDVLAELENR
ncbi:MAG: cell division protein FtsZ [Dehalococcoidia bacterium]